MKLTEKQQQKMMKQNNDVNKILLSIFNKGERNGMSLNPIAPTDIKGQKKEFEYLCNEEIELINNFFLEKHNIT